MKSAKAAISSERYIELENVVISCTSRIILLALLPSTLNYTTELLSVMQMKSSKATRRHRIINITSYLRLDWVGFATLATLAQLRLALWALSLEHV